MVILRRITSAQFFIIMTYRNRLLAVEIHFVSCTTIGIGRIIRDFPPSSRALGEICDTRFSKNWIVTRNSLLIIDRWLLYPS